MADARAAESRGGHDAYWEWAAQRLRWQRPGTSLHDGDFDKTRYFVGGQLNVADNCVDRHAEDPVRADRHAIIWEGEPETCAA